MRWTILFAIKVYHNYYWSWPTSMCCDEQSFDTTAHLASLTQHPQWSSQHNIGHVTVSPCLTWLHCLCARTQSGRAINIADRLLVPNS